jgi:hypothetical protein
MQSEAPNGGSASGPQTGGSTIHGQGQNPTSGGAETASKLIDDVYDQGEQYYRQGRQAIGNLDGVTLGGLIAAGALGFAVAWMMFNNRTDWVAERMSEGSERDYRRNRRPRSQR